MTVIGLTGFAQSGKDSAASFLAEFGFKRLAFADALRSSVFNLNPVICVARESCRAGWGRVQTIIEEMGYEEAKKRYPEYRELLQRMGTEVGRELYGESFWVDQVLDQIMVDGQIVKNAAGEVLLGLYPGDFVITDVRFPNEADAVQSVGGKIYKVVRPGTGAVNNHISDTGIDSLPTDGEILNDGDMDTFRARVLEVAGL